MTKVALRGWRRWRAQCWWWVSRLTLIFFVLSLCLVVAIRFVRPPFTAFTLSRQIEAIINKEKAFVLKQQWRSVEQITPNLALAVMASEDQRFPEHQGFDFTQLQKVIEGRNRGRVRGASTISQQLAKNLFLWSGRSYVRKGFEAWFTILIELTWSKRRILEVYLNVVEFGNGIYGAEAAAQHFFRIRASELSASQSARLAAVLPNPRQFRVDKPSQHIIARQAWIERQMQQLGGVSFAKAIIAPPKAD